MVEETFIVQSGSEKQTQDFAHELARQLSGGEIIALRGELGVGKTRFTQGLAKGLGIKRNVNSPTFTIIKEYAGRLPLYHMDLYRVEDELEALGLEEYFYGQGVCVIEWPQRMEGQLPEQRLDVRIIRKGEQDRDIEFHAIGDRYVQLLKEVQT